MKNRVWFTFSISNFQRKTLRRMMSGLEINATFVSCKKTSMYLTSMSREELYAEAHKDLIAISTKANMFIDKVRKKATMMSPFWSIVSCSTHGRVSGQRTFLKSFVCESSGKSVSLFALIKSELINTPDYGILVSKSVSLLETIRFSVWNTSFQAVKHFVSRRETFSFK